MRSRYFTWLAIVTTLAAVTAPTAYGAEAYAIDQTHSSVGFSVKHFGISTVRGRFTEFSGELMIDEENLVNSSVAIEIATASLDTGHEQRDGHLRSADFFDAENHETLTFESTKIEKTGDGEFLVTGKLTIRGMTHEVRMPVTFGGPIAVRGNLRVGIEGEITIDRQDYGVSFSRVMDTGGLIVGDDVKISFSLEASRPVEEAAADES